MTNFKTARGVFSGKTDLILRKGVYPYEYIDSLNDLTSQAYLQQRTSTASLLTKQSALKIINTPELELLTDMDMHLFIEKDMRGGISMVSKRHAYTLQATILKKKLHYGLRR